jgi:hypothetical protein
MPVAAVSAVPRLVNFSGKAVDAQGKTVAGSAGVTFSIYREQTGGAPIWIETQNIQADSKGSFTAQLGATKSGGLPVDLFSTNEPRWLGVRINGGEEQARVLLLSVPYALKAADAETIGGLPPSAFMLAAPIAAVPATAPGSGATPTLPPPPAAITGTGTVNFLPIFTAAATIGNSAVFQTGASPNAKVGINTNAPGAALDVRGTSSFSGQLTMPSNGIANAAGGKKSQVIEIRASAFNSGTSAAVPQNFVLAAEPAANNTANPTGTLNLLYAAGNAAPAETGLKINNKGQITFAAGQTFPGGGGSGTVTSVGLSAPSTDFTVSGSPVKTAGTLGLNWKVVPTSDDTGNAIVKRDSTGSFSATTINAVALNVNNSDGLAIIANAQGDAGILGGSDSNSGVSGTSVSGDGVFGISISGNGVEGSTAGVDNVGVLAENTANDAIALLATESTASSIGVSAQAPFALVANGSSLAGEFIGNVEVEGTINGSSASLKIDHPLDPANKYLNHSFVESADMMNIYNGNVTTDARGNAVIALPDWFEALNRDFRYQLTVLGQFAQAIVSSKVANHRFSIKTDKPNVEVSWQVTGIRQDAWANAHRIPVEEAKSAKERGFYKHPELFNAPPEKSTAWANFPRAMKPVKTNHSLKRAPIQNALEKTPAKQ